MKLKIFGIVATLLIVGFCLTSCSALVEGFIEGYNAALENADSSVGTSDNKNNGELGGLLHTHSFGEWTTVSEATCTEDGSKQRVCSCGEIQTEAIPKNTDHSTIEEKVNSVTFETPYADLFAIYTEVIAHRESSKCDLYIKPLLENMLYGEWKNDSGSYIDYTYIYENYDNTSGSAWYGTNLPTSKISGNTYYYYIDVKDNDLVIGYEDKLTEDKTDNFLITFKENSISVYNKIDGQTYELKMNENYNKVQKGNAKLAYVYIAKKIFSFKNPGSVKVTSCYVDYETKEVYATIQATNGFGGMTTEDYKLYEIAGSYFISEYSHNYSTNINLEELNQKLQAYVSTGG